MVDKVKVLMKNDILVRAVKTFIQAYVGAWVVFQDPFSKGAIAAGLAAGVSAVMNILKKK